MCQGDFQYLDMDKIPPVVCIETSGISDDIALFQDLTRLTAIPHPSFLLIEYRGSFDLITQLRTLVEALENQVLGYLEIVQHSSPVEFGDLDVEYVPAFCSLVKKFNLLDSQTTLYLSGCNSGLPVYKGHTPIAQLFANHLGCTVFGSAGYLSGTRIDGTEECYICSEIDPSGYPGARNATGSACWNQFTPQ